MKHGNDVAIRFNLMPPCYLHWLSTITLSPRFWYLGRAVKYLHLKRWAYCSNALNGIFTTPWRQRSHVGLIDLPGFPFPWRYHIKDIKLNLRIWYLGRAVKYLHLKRRAYSSNALNGISYYPLETEKPRRSEMTCLGFHFLGDTISKTSNVMAKQPTISCLGRIGFGQP